MLRIADDGAAGMSRGDMTAWSQVAGAMIVLLEIVPRYKPPGRAARRVGGATVGPVPWVLLASLNDADRKDEVTGTLEVEERTDAYKRSHD